MIIINSGFKINKKSELVYLTIPSFEASGITNHCFTTRMGGKSTGFYSSLNTSPSKGDNIDNVHQNLRIVCDAIDIDYRRLVFSDQTHDDYIKIVKEEDVGKGLFKPSDIVSTDGLLTNIPGIPLITFYADCVPLFFLDPIKKVVGVVHSGWKGTVSKIAVKAIEKMKSEFGCSPKDCLVGIGPSIEMDCFEVGTEVLDRFRASFGYWKEFSKVISEHKALIDLWKVNELMLIEAGVPKENITVSGMCTKCDSSMFYSHRRDGEKRGSLSAIVELKTTNNR